MFGMRFSLDILWLNAKREVVHIEKNARPWRGLFWPASRAQYVLELNAGQAGELGIQKGTLLTYAE